jgi:hypothetical protein
MSASPLYKEEHLVIKKKSNKKKTVNSQSVKVKCCKSCCCCCNPCLLLIWIIICLLKDKKNGNANGNGNGNGGITGPISTGPFFIRTGENNAINVKVQNTGTDPVDVAVRLYDLDECPPEIIDDDFFTLQGGCCVDDAVLTAPAGNFEVVICPEPLTASLRAFVSVHSGNSTNSAFEYVIKAAEMLPVACSLCQVAPE